MTDGSEQESALTFRPLSQDCRGRGFSCGEKDIDKWFCDKARKHHRRLLSRVRTAHLAGNPAPVGFHSLCVKLEPETDLTTNQGLSIWRSDNKMYASLHLEWLAVHRKFHGCGFGKLLLIDAVEQFYNSIMSFGIPAMTLVAINTQMASFYENLGFRRVGSDIARPKMFLPAKSAIDLFES